MASGSKLDTSVLDDLLLHLDGNTSDAVIQIAFMVEQRAKLKAPVDTGALKASIYVSAPHGSDGLAAMSSAQSLRPEAIVRPLPTPRDDHTAYVGPSVKYGQEVELGSSSRAGTPYLQPALRETERDARDVLSKAVKNGK